MKPVIHLWGSHPCPKHLFPSHFPVGSSWRLRLGNTLSPVLKQRHSIRGTQRGQHLGKRTRDSTGTWRWYCGNHRSFRAEVITWSGTVNLKYFCRVVLGFQVSAIILLLLSNFHWSLPLAKPNPMPGGKGALWYLFSGLDFLNDLAIGWL